ncbi:ABC transporter substrate-binding protein [Allomeiothermus silvanus]|uniref:ABC transporter substrate-binding protein n=1 Tax=Allomeiothermus silvanus TaxID=52022 RepID=UPI0023F024DB|nr:sugar ABC transporter substrate-binding protein [Allomeiothermus silvanus]
MGKPWIVLVFVLLLASGLAKTTINYFSFTTDQNHVKDLEALIATFEKENPELEVKYTTAPFDSYFTKLQTNLAAGQAPDVFELNYENFVTFASRGTLLALDSFLRQDTSLKDTFYPAALNAFRQNNSQYGLPITFSTVVLFYNKDLFDKAGVTYPNASWTWKDVLSAAQKINNPAQRVWGVYQPVQFWEFYKVARQAGGGLQVSPSVQIDTPANREALRYLVDKVRLKLMPSDAEMSGVSNEDMFLNGQLGMLYSGIWMFDKFSQAKFKWDIAAEPGGIRKATHFFSNAAVISRSTKNAEAAFKWIKFLAASPITVKTRIERSWELPALSLAQRALLDAYLKKPLPANREAVFDSLQYAITPPVVENQSQLQDIINQELEAARLGSKTPEQALADAQRRVEALFRR